MSWINKADDRVLETLEQSGLALSPKVIGYNADYTRNYVSQRLKILVEKGLVSRVDNGMYEITNEGRAYLEGELKASDLDAEDD